MVAIIGSVGSGKTSILSALLGELYKVKGTVSVSGKIAYVSQTAWIVNATVKDNVIFGNTYNEELYENCIKVCQLESDREVLPNGDETEIGEKGINLSGGQRQRVSMARAVYDNADVYLFDDPLSALDAEVGKKIFNDCIKGQLEKKTRILVTNQLQYLSSCDVIYVVDEGKIFESGSYDELMSKGLDFSSMMKSFGSEDTTASPSKDKEKNPQDSTTVKKSSVTTPGAVASSTAKKDGKLIDVEEREKGAVKSSAYYKWLAASESFYLFFIALFLFMVMTIASAAQQFWIAVWIQAVDPKTNQLLWVYQSRDINYTSLMKLN